MKRNIRDLKVGDKLKFGKPDSIYEIDAGDIVTVSGTDKDPRGRTVFGPPYNVMLKTPAYEFSYVDAELLNKLKVKLVTND